MRPFLVLSSVCTAAVVLVSTGVAGPPAALTLNPPAPSYYVCKTVGNGTICEGSPPVESYGPIDTADEGSPIVCGSGASAFHVFDTATDVVHARRIYDANGNLVRRVLTDDYTFGEFSNPLTGATVAYTQRDRRTSDFSLPGDLASATETTTWEVSFHVPGAGAPVLLNNGRTVVGPDGAIESRAGRLEFFDLFADGDTSVVDRLCDALSGA